MLNGKAIPPEKPLVKVRVDGAAGSIILDRAEKRNALSRGLIGDVLDSLDKLHGDRNVRAVVLTGAGSAFCSGLDLAEMQEASQSADAQKLWFDDAMNFHNLLDKIWKFPKPVIAAVNGTAIGGGLGLAAACDLIIASPEAIFAAPEPKRGIVAGIVAPFIAFRLGGARSAKLLLTGGSISADVAKDWGLASEVVPHASLWARGVELCKEIAESSPDAIALTKRLLNETIGEHLMTSVTAGAAASAASRTTDAATEGLAAFLEKRPPQWW